MVQAVSCSKAWNVWNQGAPRANHKGISLTLPSSALAFLISHDPEETAKTLKDISQLLTL